MKKIILSLLILSITTGITNAQKNFELGATANAGYYFPINEGIFGSSDKQQGFSSAIGTYLSYQLSGRTHVDIGLNYRLLHTEVYAHSNLHPAVTWHYLAVPFEIRQNFGKKIFATTGISVLTSLQEVPNNGQNTEMTWKLGAGFDLKKGRISVQFERGFNNVTKYAKIEDSQNYLMASFKHQEIYIRLEYPLWSF
ncbi:hypothetical protein [Maribellus maritimus]|uniref:hypothetical protein n=1 Tax=Maribellus maritimus TaxID=2870838 RepID=UPI001EEBEABF|nr:hypothetical protein [Maribellus maritimus]MCG6188195.1 hypothetical protein [Maribellus maritimus]